MTLLSAGILLNGRVCVRLKEPWQIHDHQLEQASRLDPRNLQSAEHVAEVGKTFGNSSLSVVIADLPSERRRSRKRRSVLQLASMLKCVTGCSPLSFQGYGCFCGFLGDGAPVDSIDKYVRSILIWLNVSIVMMNGLILLT